jgi:hypothetical protein
VIGMHTRTLVLVLLLGAALPARAQIVDPGDVDELASLPQCVMDGIGAQRWLFTHASVGSNMVAGLDDLRVLDPVRYQLETAGVGYDGGALTADPPPAPTVAGTVYECGRGNPGWQEKFTIFDNSVRLAGWRATAVDAVLDKLCYIDEGASAAGYLTSMDALALSYPTTAVVYATMPLTTGEDAANVLRNLYNEAVRAHCATNGALLYDIADIEAHAPDGAEQTFESGGETYQKLYAGYTSDGGHLDTEGRQRVAQGWYATAATLTPCWIFADGFEGGDATDWSPTAP